MENTVMADLELKVVGFFCRDDAGAKQVCSDGLTGPVPDDKLLSFIQEHPNVQECADGLGQLALEMGSRDNVSCIVIEVVES